MEAAAKELATHGYEGASLNRILAEAELSKGAAYYYFDGKEDLLATMFAFLWDELAKKMPTDLSRVTSETFWPFLEGIGNSFMQSAVDEPWLISAAKAIWGLPHDARTEGPLGEVFSAMEGWLESIMQHGLELGVVRDDLPIGLLLAMVLGMDEAGDRWVLEHYDELGQEEVERIWNIVFGMWRRMLSPQKEA
jgi:AcrR family transcriptional regulator